MSEHTPGTWDIEYGQLHPASELCGYTIRTEEFDVVSGHLAIRREADALLIAAAPEMFLSIVAMLKCAKENNMEKGAEVLALMEEVVQKVTGNAGA